MKVSPLRRLEMSLLGRWLPSWRDCVNRGGCRGLFSSPVATHDVAGPGSLGQQRFRVAVQTPRAALLSARLRIPSVPATPRIGSGSTGQSPTAPRRFAGSPTRPGSTVSGVAPSSTWEHFKEAVAGYDRSIGLDSGNVAANLGRCQARFDLGRHEQALKSLYPTI